MQAFVTQIMLGSLKVDKDSRKGIKSWIIGSPHYQTFAIHEQDQHHSSVS